MSDAEFLPAVQPRDRAAWRAWLARNHATSDGVWVLTFKKATGKPSPTYDELVEEALCFGWIDSTVRRVDEERTAQRYSPRRDPTTWSRSNLARMKALRAAKLVTPAGLAVFKPAPGYDEPRPPPSEKAPTDLRQAMEESPAAKRFWKTLAPGYRRLYVGWIENAKRPETRARRVRAAVAHLAAGTKNPFM